MPDAFRTFEVLRVNDGHREVTSDVVAAEEPLEVRLEGEPFSVIMRTPGADEELAVGFLFTERVLRRGADLRLVETTDSPNVINVRLSRDRAEILPELLGQRRQVVTNSSCGMCGRRELESLQVNEPALDYTWTMTRGTIAALPHALRAAQPGFSETGGLHAAALFDINGRLESSAEDVGRHNAVDKLLGRMLLKHGLPLQRSVLFVSGRTSFEIVQKAFLGGIGLIGAVSAPSSLAIELARQSGITLLGFVRDERFNVYSHQQRVKTD